MHLSSGEADGDVMLLTVLWPLLSRPACSSVVGTMEVAGWLRRGFTDRKGKQQAADGPATSGKEASCLLNDSPNCNTCHGCCLPVDTTMAAICTAVSAPRLCNDSQK